jgi:hypothetical protein
VGTPFSSIIDRGMTMFQDWRVDALYNTNYSSFYQYMVGYVENASDDFDGVLKDLSYTTQTESGSTVYYFNSTLTNKEIRILAMGLCLSWMQNNLNDVRQMNTHLNIKDFKSFSEGNNLKQRQEQYDKLREDFKREIMEYQMQDENFTTLPFFKDLSSTS